MNEKNKRLEKETSELYIKCNFLEVEKEGFRKENVELKKDLDLANKAVLKVVKERENQKETIVKLLKEYENYKEAWEAEKKIRLNQLTEKEKKNEQLKENIEKEQKSSSGQLASLTMEFKEQVEKLQKETSELYIKCNFLEVEKEGFRKENVELKLQIERLEKVIEKIEKDRLRINKKNQDLRDEINGFGESIGNVIK